MEGVTVLLAGPLGLVAVVLPHRLCSGIWKTCFSGYPCLVGMLRCRSHVYCCELTTEALGK